MDFELTESERAVQRTFHDFAAREIRPRAAELDRAPVFPRELFARAGELGFFGMRYPEPLGSGATVLEYVLAVEELAWGSLAVAAACSMQSLMGTWLVHRHAPSPLREALLEPAMRGEKVGCICMTEPEAGSDLASIATRAVERDGAFYLTGTKTWITSAPVGDFFTVFARTGDEELSVFLVLRDAPGLTVGRAIDKAGVRASLTSEVFFEDARAACMLGPRGSGMQALRAILAEIRVMTAALSVGLARAAFEDARAYASSRRQFGRPIESFQAVQAHLAEMAVDVEAARRLTHWAAWRSDRGLENATEASMAKLFASEAAVRVCDRAARVVASWAYATDHPVERYVRDARFTVVGGGTSEILRTMIARGL